MVRTPGWLENWAPCWLTAASVICVILSQRFRAQTTFPIVYMGLWLCAIFVSYKFSVFSEYGSCSGSDITMFSWLMVSPLSNLYCKLNVIGISSIHTEILKFTHSERFQSVVLLFLIKMQPYYITILHSLDFSKFKKISLRLWFIDK